MITHFSVELDELVNFWWKQLNRSKMESLVSPGTLLLLICVLFPLLSANFRWFFSVTLIVKSCNQQFEDQEIRCELNWTIRKLKQQLAEVYPTKPVSLPLNDIVVFACVFVCLCWGTHQNFTRMRMYDAISYNFPFRT